MFFCHRLWQCSGLLFAPKPNTVIEKCQNPRKHQPFPTSKCGFYMDCNNEPTYRWAIWELFLWRVLLPPLPGNKKLQEIHSCNMRVWSFWIWILLCYIWCFSWRQDWSWCFNDSDMQFVNFLSLYVFWFLLCFWI